MVQSKKTRKPGPEAERLVIAPEDVRGVIDRLLATPKAKAKGKAKKPAKKKPKG